MLCFALQGDFDVRWLRGSASDLIFAPWQSAIERDGGRVIGGKRVSTIRLKGTAAQTVDGARGTTQTVDGAIGTTGIKAGEGKEEDHAQDLSSGADGDSEAGLGRARVRVETTDGDVFEPDAVVLAVGITAAKVFNKFAMSSIESTFSSVFFTLENAA